MRVKPGLPGKDRMTRSLHIEVLIRQLEFLDKYSKISVIIFLMIYDVKVYNVNTKSHHILKQSSALTAMWSSGSRTEERCKVRRPHSTLGLVCIELYFFLKIIIKLKQSQESKFHAEVTKLTLKKMTFEEWFFFKGAKKGKLHKDQFLRMTKICVINGVWRMRLVIREVWIQFS